jgi:hypothetical protein
MAMPEYLVCLDCETPCYVFEWDDGEVLEALCESCGNDDPEEFATEEEYEALMGGGPGPGVRPPGRTPRPKEPTGS